MNLTGYISILLTFLQVPEAGLDPVTRWAILLSLECAFASLMYGVIYIGHFHSLKGVTKGLNWVLVSGSLVACGLRSRLANLVSKAAGQTNTAPYWNIWLFLAMPALWLTWSLLFFCISLFLFIWRSGDRRPLALTPFTDETAGYLPNSPNHFAPFWPRLILTVIFLIGTSTFLLVWKVFKLHNASERWLFEEDEEDKKD